MAASNMYRHSAQIHVARSSLPSPAPDDLSDSESEILAELDGRRREIDEEIARFKAHKEKEFHNFEKELRSKRKNHQHRPRDTQAKTATITSAVSSLFAGKQARPNGHVRGKKSIDDHLSPNLRPKAFPSKATVSIDRLTINGTTTPPVIGSPPFTKSLSRSPTNLSSLSLTPPRSGFIKPPLNEKCEADFNGVITPMYLPLLESRGSSLSPSRVISPQPTRSLTAPIVPSTSLPSALRTASGTTMRKKKHVTFQLNDSMIVEPSSSYEEIPSPEKLVEREQVDEMMDKAVKSYTPPTSPGPAREIAVVLADFRDGLSAAADGGSGVGFFELDEELNDLDDREIDHHEVGEHPARRGPDVILMLLQDPDDDVLKNSDNAPENELKPESFRAGSLPIDIVKPGSFRNSAAMP